MADRIHIAPDELRTAARQHREAADQLSGLPATHDDIMASLDSLGPIFSELRDAGRDLLEQRRICYEQQAVAHAELAANLDHAAAVWELHDSASAQELRGLTEGGV